MRNPSQLLAIPLLPFSIPRILLHFSHLTGLYRASLASEHIRYRRSCWAGIGGPEARTPLPPTGFGEPWEASSFQAVFPLGLGFRVVCFVLERGIAILPSLDSVLLPGLPCLLRSHARSPLRFCERADVSVLLPSCTRRRPWEPVLNVTPGETAPAWRRGRGGFPPRLAWHQQRPTSSC